MSYYDPYRVPLANHFMLLQPLRGLELLAAEFARVNLDVDELVPEIFHMRFADKLKDHMNMVNYLFNFGFVSNSTPHSLQRKDPVSWLFLWIAMYFARNSFPQTSHMVDASPPSPPPTDPKIANFK